MSEIAAAIGAAQMTRLTGIVDARRALAARYRQALRGLPLTMQEPAPSALPNHQTFGIVLRAEARLARDAVVEALATRGVQAGALSHALHRLPHLGLHAEAARREGRSLETSAAIATRGLALPLYPAMSHADQDRVIDAVRAVLD